MRLRAVMAAVAAVAVLGTGACGGGPVAPRGAGAAAAPSAAGGQRSGIPVPASLRFDGTTLSGQPFSGATLAGRPVVLWFWAPWCATCAGQAASVADVAKKYGDRVGVVGVPGMGEVAAMREFVTEFELGGVTQLNDQAGAVWRRFEVAEQSTYVLLDRDGRIVHRGWLDSVQLADRVGALAG